MLWGMTLLYFQPVLGRHNIRPPHFASKVSYSASPQSFAKCPHIAFCCYAATAMLIGSKSRKSLRDFLPNNMAFAPLPLKGAHIPG